MRDFIQKAAICLVLLAGLFAGLLPGAARAAQKRPVKGERPSQAEAYSLEDVMKSPREYLHREIVFYCRFAATANLFKQVNTRFNPNHHVNLAVWPDKTALWTTEGRKNVLPTLYIAKNEEALLSALKNTGKYELLVVTGEVQSVYAGYPWILVSKIEAFEKPGEHLSELTIEHMQAGFNSLDAGSGAAAAAHFEQALKFGLPPEYLATAHKQMAQAYLLENRLDLARDALRQAVGEDACDPVLHLALADVCLRMDEPEEAIGHASLALNLSGKYPQAYGIRGEAQSLLGRYADAFADLNAAAGTPGITPKEKATVSLRRARIYARSDRPADAARLYAVISEPGEALAADANVHNEIGLFYERLFLESGDARYLDSALEAFGEAARLATLNPIFLYNQAEVEFRRQKLSAAPDFGKVLGILEKIDRINPDYAPARLLHGRVLHMQGEAGEAERIYQSVAPHLGKDAMALLALAEAYVELGRYGDATIAVQAARDAQPWNRRLQALGRHIGTEAAEKTRSASADQESGEADGFEASDKYYSDEWIDVGAVMRSESDPFDAPDREGVADGAEKNAAPAPLRPPAQGAFVGEGNDLSALAAPRGAGPDRLPAGRVRLPEAPAAGVRALNLDFAAPAPAADGSAGDPRGRVREATLDADGFLQFGMLENAGAAYASLAVPSARDRDGGEGSVPEGGDRVRVPPPFTFTPDTSPVLIADVRPHGAPEERRAVRNANLYRRYDGVRRAAEITEREPLSPPRIGDAAAMAPPSGSAAAPAMPRTRVLLPSSSAGIGSATDSP